MQGLYRSAMQRKQADFLARDFSQLKHREAACKNAFVLLGQHRYELAAAFFILGGAPPPPLGPTRLLYNLAPALEDTFSSRPLR